MPAFSPLELLSQQPAPASDAQVPEGVATSKDQLVAGLRGMDFAQGAEALAPAAQAPAQSQAPQQAPEAAAPAAPTPEDAAAPPTLQSAVLAGVQAFQDALSGKAFMRPGCSDRAAVGVLQGVLQQLGHDCGLVDGLWGGRTTGAVKGFQSAHGLAPDAIIGPLTAGALDQTAGQTRGAGPSGVLVGPDGGTPSSLGYNADEVMEFDTSGNYIGTNTYDLDAKANGWEDTDGLPWSPFLLSWEHEKILKRWSQVDKTKSTLTDRTRCQAQVAMAARIVAGPDTLTSYAREVKTELINNMVILTMQVRIADPAGTGPEAKTLGELPTRLDTAIEHMGTLTSRPLASFEDLDWIAEAARWALVGPTAAQPSPADAAKAHGLGLGASDFTAMSQTVTNRAQLQGLLQSLVPGESYSVGVDPNDVPAGQPSAATHSVTLGKDGSGKLYLYDPFPKVGDQYIEVSFVDEVRFWPYFEKQSPLQPRQFKETVIDAKAKASTQPAGGSGKNPWDIPPGSLPDFPGFGFDPNDPLGLGLGLSH
ncbi:MAG: peptidoglycan-binding protein [Deltaproteobacteria bacterium]|nr:peptidoglycan-binding protein [Deltaproteobacteria bacterium]MCB9788468.1 peptidoglycan-binding protein [Deltaproteobacteria bacterium]